MDRTCKEVSSRVMVPCEEPGAPLAAGHSSGGAGHSRSRRVAVHEAGHVVAARVFGRLVTLATVVPGADFGGRVWSGDGPVRDFSEMAANIADVCDKVNTLMPRDGESKEDAAVWFFHAYQNLIELMAGLAAEDLILGAAVEAGGRHDYDAAVRYALTIASSTAGPELLAFARAEARAIIGRHRGALLAVADALELRGELAGAEIDKIILEALARADKDERRADWRAVIARAADFSARQEGAPALSLIVKGEGLPQLGAPARQVDDRRGGNVRIRHHASCSRSCR